MLVRRRKVGEVILIGDVQVKILSIRGGKVDVGVQAPKSVDIKFPVDSKQGNRVPLN